MGVLLGERGEGTPLVVNRCQNAKCCVQQKPVLPTLSAAVDSTSHSVSGCRAKAKQQFIGGVLPEKNVITLREGKREEKKKKLGGGGSFIWPRSQPYI